MEMTMKAGKTLLMLGVLASSPVHGFMIQNAPTRGRSVLATDRTTTRLRLTEAEIPIVSMTARGESVFWFFGASGAAGIARSAVPKLFTNFLELRDLGDKGSTLGGETLGISPFCLYPRDLSKADVEKVVNNPLTVDEIVDKYPVEGLYLASMGYLHVSAFERANEGANPLAVRAIFDTFAVSSDTAEPKVAQARLDAYKKDLNAFKFNLLKSKVVGLSAIFTLLFLLGLTDIIFFNDVQVGWFPDWPGAKSFPLGMFTEPNGSPLNIPNFWI